MYIFCIIFGILSIIFIIQYNKKNKELKQLKDKKFQEAYQEEFNKIKNRIDKDTELLRKNKEKIEESTRHASERLLEVEKQLLEKINFNENLKKIREDELNRLIEHQRIEKEKALNEKYQLREKEANIKLEEKIKSWNLEAENTKKKITEEINTIQEILNDFKKKQKVINEAIIREKEIQEKENFYKINISKNDIEDIEILEQIRPRLKNREALSKLIWEVFIRRETQEMIKRVTSGRKISGIYKITYIKTGEAYIGKTSDIQTRWQNHCKTALGLDGCAHSTFHTRLEKDGLWNYTFEILEEVDKDKLSEREKYWIDFYNTKTMGLNQKEG